MATTNAYALAILTNYTNAEEALYALDLAGASAGSAVIYNTDLNLTRIWNGVAFANAPNVNVASIPLVTTTANGLAPATGTPAGNYLKDDLTWTAIPASGLSQAQVLAINTLRLI